MIDNETHAYLQSLIRQEGRSMLQYVSESFPWTTPENQALLPELKELARQEREGAEGLTRFLLRQRGRPTFLGAYPMSFTNINFIALDHLLPRLVTFQQDRTADLEKGLERVLHEETRVKLRELLTTKKRHQAHLEGMSLRLPPSGPSDRRSPPQ